jgi:sialidase-1
MEVYLNSIKTLLCQEWGGVTTDHLTAVQLPRALQKLPYTNAAYVEVNRAIKKKGFDVDPSWKPTDSAKTRAGFVEMPMLTGDKPGASFDLPFQGRSVGIAVVAGPDAGIIKYSIDGKEEKELDTFNRYSKALHLPQYFLLGDELKNGRHMLHVQIADKHNEQSKGTALRIAYFLVNQ